MASRGADVLLDRISSESVRDATGRGWDEWLEALDTAGAAEWSHKETVAHLAREHPAVSGWWRQAITVGYEQARGKRVLGETADAGFQLGVQRTVAVNPREAWELVASRPELWLGEGAAVKFEPGARFDSPAASGEIRVVKPGQRLRMAWQPLGWPAPATLQLTFTESGAGKTAIGVHLERLPDAAAREEMRGRFREALDRIARAAS
jgi:uncharacterized protein YndB with AHSA1/START domain